MIRMMIVFCFVLISCMRYVNCDSDLPPNIITILADDLGWNDVGFHGSNQIPTPNIDALGYNGIILNNHYVQPLCTPSRAAFLTGKYPIHTGMQHSVILEQEPRGLPLSEKLLPQYLRESGYVTHAVGKWHLGFFRSEYTPTYRGFDTHYGYWNGFQDYFNQSVIATFNRSVRGLDLRRNMDTDRESVGKYSTYLYTDEAVRLINNHNTSKPMFLYMAHLAPHTGNVGNAFQAPDSEIAKFSHIPDPERRIYAAMVSALDQSVGEIISALRQKGMLGNSIILFISDNGAPTYGLHSNRGSNYPFRGQKDSVWEGGVKGVAAVWSPLFKKFKRVSNDIVHITDWLPTFWSAIGRDEKELGNIDGVNMWETLTEGKVSRRQEFVVNINDVMSNAGIRFNEWKYIVGNTSYGSYDEWYGEPRHEEGTYDPYNVLFSKACVAITGYITENQLKDKQKKNFSEQYTMVPLQSNDIEDLRRTAIVNCSTKEPVECNPRSSPCLFNLIEDPCEMINLAAEKPVILASMQELTKKYMSTMVKAPNLPPDPRADPSNFGGVWSNWLDDVIIDSPKTYTDNKVYILIIIGILLCSTIFIGLFIKLRKSYCRKKKTQSISLSAGKGSILYRSSSLESQRRTGHSRENVISPVVSVAQRVEMFEDKDSYKSRI